MATYPLRIDARGRITLPAALREECGLAEGQAVVAVVEPDGRVVLFARDRLMQDLREACAQMGPQWAIDDLDRCRDESDLDRFGCPKRPPAEVPPR